MATRTMVFTKDTANKKLLIERSFDGTLEQVWQAWTDSTILDQWWAPKPYWVETKKMDFRVGGMWLYCMAGPDGDRHWCNEEYHAIEPLKSIRATDGFCDEDGNNTVDFPKMYWLKKFSKEGEAVKVNIEVSFDSEADLEKYLASGFKEGFEAGMNNLDEYLAA